MKIRALIELLEQAAKEHGEDVEVGIDDADTRGVAGDGSGYALDILALGAHEGGLLLSGEYGSLLYEVKPDPQPEHEEAPPAPDTRFCVPKLPEPRPLWG